MEEFDSSFLFSQPSSPREYSHSPKNSKSKVFKKKKIHYDQKEVVNISKYQPTDETKTEIKDYDPPPPSVMNPENNSAYNRFFRNLRIMSLLRTNYFEQIVQGKIPVKNNIILVKNFNPYFAMGFLKPNMTVHYYINQYFLFKDPFHIEVNNSKEYASIIKAFTAKKYSIKSKVKFGRDIYKKDLNIAADTLPNFKISFNKEITLQQLLASYSKVPIIIIDCSDQEGIFEIKPEKKNFVIRF
jgi:hypothetical protein